MKLSMKTAVEWLEDEIQSDMTFMEVLGLIRQAKEMEKEQIINTYRDGRSDQQSEKPSRFYNRMAEQYYNETFKSE
jgi:hypothetical protein